MELREKIEKAIAGNIRTRIVYIRGTHTAFVDDLDSAADAILSIPELAQALKKAKESNEPSAL